MGRPTNGVQGPEGCPMFPGFPVEVGDVAELHAAFREESRTRGCVPKPA